MKTPTEVNAIPVTRSPDGSWVHPAWQRLLQGWKSADPVYLVQWLTDHDLEYKVTWPEYGVLLTEWQPSAPAGDGWFIVSLRSGQTEPQCIWLRPHQPGGEHV